MDNELLYKRGYLILDATKELPSFLKEKNWDVHEHAHLTVLADSAVDVFSETQNGVVVTVIGTILNPVQRDIGPEQATKELCSKYAVSENDLFDYLDELSGRFVILITKDGESRIIQDSIGSRSVFYDKHSAKTLISSHAEIIADLNEYSVGEEELAFMNSAGFKNNRDSHFPGISTPYKEIKMLTPNTLLELKGKQVKRFFPREALVNQVVTERMVKELSSIFTNQIDLMNGRKKLAVSLTAGLDSRLTLACSKNSKDDIYYYTMTYGGESIQDTEVARLICEKLDLQHHTLPTEGASSKDFTESFLKNTSYMSTDFRAKIAEALSTQYPEDHLHVKSNGSEICRSFYRQKYGFLPKKPTASIYSKLYGIEAKSDFVLKSMDEFMITTNLNNDTAINYDVYDLFYWEHKIGNWQSLCIFEWDVAQDTFIPFGNREILKKMLSAPLKQRLNDELYYRIIKEAWAETLEVPINPFKTTKKTMRFKRLLKGIKFRLK